MEDEETLPYVEHFDKEIQDEMIILDNLLLEQVRVKNKVCLRLPHMMAIVDLANIV